MGHNPYEIGLILIIGIDEGYAFSARELQASVARGGNPPVAGVIGDPEAIVRCFLLQLPQSNQSPIR
jgi:hypothetical protein